MNKAVMNQLTEQEISEINKVSKSNATAETILTDLALRERMRTSTDLSRYRTHLMKEGAKIVEQDYVNTFKALQAIELGKFDRNNKFKWFRNLIIVGKAAVDPESLKKELSSAPKEKEIVVMKRSRGRPKGSKNKPKVLTTVKRGRGRPKKYDMRSFSTPQGKVLVFVLPTNELPENLLSLIKKIPA